MSGLVPKLRFPEFNGAWEEVPLSELSSFVAERVGDGECVPYTVTSGVGLMTQDAKFGRTIAGNSLRNYIRLRKDDFAYNKSATKAFPEGYIARYRDDAKAAVPNSIFTCFRTDPEKIEAAYLDYLFASNLHGRWLRKFLTIGARAHGSLNVSDSDLMTLPVPIPAGEGGHAEQRKIGECLTSLDELIAAEGRRLEVLRKWKKALLQNLFPREGETTPRLRFPEFQDAGEWVTRPLGELLSRGPEYGLNAPAVPYSPELPTYIRITDIDDDGQFLANNKVSVAVAVSANDYLRGGDIVLARTGASVGKSYRYRPEDGDLVYAGFLIRVRPDEARLDSRLLANYLTTPQYWDWVRVTSARSGQPGINGAEYASFPVPLPQPDPDGGISEQRRIASCLGALDTLITEQAKKLDTLKTHKQGLMQGLFPSAEEI